MRLAFLMRDMITTTYPNGAVRSPRPCVKILDITEMDRFGTMKWFSEEKSYGFIEPDDGGRDVFVHRSIAQLYGLRPIDMLSGVRVAFKVNQKAGRGPEATAIALA